MTLNDAVNEILKHAPAFREIRIFPMMLKSSEHIVIADGRIVQGMVVVRENGEDIKITRGMIVPDNR